jgi:hypothetical protein
VTTVSPFLLHSLSFFDLLRIPSGKALFQHQNLKDKKALSNRNVITVLRHFLCWFLPMSHFYPSLFVHHISRLWLSAINLCLQSLKWSLSAQNQSPEHRTGAHFWNLLQSMEWRTKWRALADGPAALAEQVSFFVLLSDTDDRLWVITQLSLWAPLSHPHCFLGTWHMFGTQLSTFRGALEETLPGY